MYHYINPKKGTVSPKVSTETYQVVMDNADRLNGAIVSERDYGYSYFGFKVMFGALRMILI